MEQAIVPAVAGGFQTACSAGRLVTQSWSSALRLAGDGVGFRLVGASAKNLKPPAAPGCHLKQSSIVPVDTQASFDSAACVARVRQRDEAAARRLMEHLYPLVLKIVRAHQPRRLDEEDLTQMVFMKVFASLDRYSGQAPVEHWVSRIAVNTCLNQLKAEKARPELRWADLSEEQSQMLETVVADAQDLPASASVGALELIEQLLAPLEPRERLLLRWMHLEGRSCEEIAALTGWNRTLVRVRAFRARRKLRKLFGKLIAEEKL